MNDTERKEALKEIRQDLGKAWFYLFVIQLVVGGHAIYELSSKYPDMGFLQYSFLLILGAALIAAVLLTIVVVLFSIMAAIFVGIQVWREHRREKHNDAS